MNVLWLVSWYPSRVNFLNGDFVERHAKAASLLNHNYVIYVVKDASVLKVLCETKHYTGHLTAAIYYYPAYTSAGRLIEIVHSNIYYLLLHFKAYKRYRQQYGRPKGILVHVAFKAGIIALLFKLIYRIPFILFERWSGMLDGAKPNFRELHFFQRHLWKTIAKSAECLVTVSHHLGRQINRLHLKKSYFVIPNIVDDQLFYTVQKTEKSNFRFIHVSTLDYPKNFEDILRATQIVRDAGYKIELVVYGPFQPHLLELTNVLNLKGMVTFKGEVEHAIIAQAMQQSDALILYSRYETFGNVIVEANSCGLPVIVSNYPTFEELVQEKFNGIVAKGEAPEELAMKMQWIIDHYHTFDSERISRSTMEKYHPQVIGKLFDQLFQKFY
jgi:glycosyltransferase involved in cell wall biosynthesis